MNALMLFIQPFASHGFYFLLSYPYSILINYAIRSPCNLVKKGAVWLKIIVIISSVINEGPGSVYVLLAAC